jgi:glyoxylase-like metal-dependent hydrolase (beta-lactamase superfamily II)
MTDAPAVWICATCGVEHADPTGVCAICADERQWVPAEGQIWTTLAELAAEGCRTVVTEPEPDLLGITSEPKVGIGQQTHVVTTPAGSLLWDPIAYVDDDAVRRIRDRGEVLAIAASHPHMFGLQLEWSRALGGVPILVCEPHLEWVQRPDPAIEVWRGVREVAPGLVVLELGGHFPGSSVVHWTAGAGGRGALFSSDTIHANPDRATVTFLRSYPNRIPLSPAVVERLARATESLGFERLYDNFGRTIDSDAAAAVRTSADRYIGWVRGDFDDLT